MFFVEDNTMMVTVDSDYMLKKWDIKTGKGIATVMIQRAQHYRNGSIDLNDGGIGKGSYDMPKLDFVIYSPIHKNMAIADEVGVITVNNLTTGTLLYTLSHSSN